jgi:shikimate dehydrogenase
MIKLGLLGKSIQHSLSQKMYEDILGKRIHYTLFDYPSSLYIPDLSNLFRDVVGLSITAPYKQHFVAQLNLSAEAIQANAVNCINQNKSNQFLGHNTDYLACEELINKYVVDKYSDIIILGNGPMARILLFLLKEHSLNIYHVYRHDKFNINDFDMRTLGDKRICIINCCSRGVVFAPKLHECKVDLFWDLNYGQNNLFSGLYDNNYLDGLELLKLQAKFALNIWEIK